MMYRAAIALLALAIPAYTQRGGAHAGSIGSRGSAGHVGGFSGSSGFSRSPGFARTAPQFRLGTPGIPGYRQTGPPRYANLGAAYNGDRLQAGRSASLPGAQLSSAGNRNLFAARRRSFQNWYVHTYPTWPGNGYGYGYPYLIDPGFYDWGDSDNSANNQSSAAPNYPAPYPDYGYGAPSEPPPASEYGDQRAPATLAAPSAPGQPLTVVFKGGRAPVKMQNYMMTARFLTDLDSQHYEQIPVDQIDVAATQQTNSASGVSFEIPASRD